MSVEDILGVIRIALTDIMDNRYFKYLTKTINYNIVDNMPGQKVLSSLKIILTFSNQSFDFHKRNFIFQTEFCGLCYLFSSQEPSKGFLGSEAGCTPILMLLISQTKRNLRDGIP